MKGTLGIKRYFIEEREIFLQDRETLVERIRQYRFHPIDGSPVEEAVGWVSPFRSYDSNISVEDTFLDSNIFLAMRLDQKSVSKLLLENRVNQRLHSGEIVPKGKEELKQLKEDTMKELLIQALPAPKIVEGVIDLPHATLYLNTGSHRVSSLFLSLFEKTFNLLPVHIDPTTFVLLTLKDEGQLQTLSDAGESCFYDV